MITVFNRKEVLVTMDMKKQAEVRDILDANGIKHVVDTKDRQGSQFMGSNRGRYGSLGVSQQYSCEYRIFVRKDDYDRAMSVLR